MFKFQHHLAQKNVKLVLTFINILIQEKQDSNVQTIQNENERVKSIRIIISSIKISRSTIPHPLSSPTSNPPPYPDRHFTHAQLISPPFSSPFPVVTDLNVLIKHPNVATNYYNLSLSLPLAAGLCRRSPPCKLPPSLNVEVRVVEGGVHRPGICIQVASVSNPSPIIPVPRRLSADAIG